ncbi:MAG: alpha-mannosidase [Clostridia bacterium]|nr:alpha-mannosidase [Clostridia bacterium]
MKQKLHLLCNAHLDPVWLWQWKEGAAEAISTFRVAADFCEEYDGFVFNHNEAVLYQWVEEYEPELFRRIQKLVAEKKWHIMGGWYLQPDCVMTSGESILNQIDLGQSYFKEKFGASFETAINFDPFGHSRGLVQILAKKGYKNYIYMRPSEEETFDFNWVGFDGSKICAHNIFGGYATLKGNAREKIEDYLKKYPGKENGLILWGIGNHGGGPSRIDMENIAAIREELKDTCDIVHSDTDSYFATVDKENLPERKASLGPTMVGCYTSQVRIKQAHRALENKLMQTEKIVACAKLSKGADFDADTIFRARKDLAFSQFHDILPGSAIKPVEEDSLRLFHHAEEDLDRVFAKAFFTLCDGQPKPQDKQIPVMVYNPHPYAVEGDFEVEFLLENQNWNDGEQTVATVFDENGTPVPCQNEKPACTFNLDWIQKVSFHGTAKPSGITRFNCALRVEKDYTMPAYTENEDTIFVKNETASVAISKKTGLIASYVVNGKSLLKSQTGVLEVYRDDEDPWAMRVSAFPEKIGEFSLISDEDTSDFIGYEGEIVPGVRVIENGDLRTVVQAIFRYDKTYAVTEYTLPKHGAYLDVHHRLFSANANKMIKYRLDTTMPNGVPVGQTAFGVQELLNDGSEDCYQKWCGIQKDGTCLAVLNRGTYGGSFSGGSMFLSLLRTPLYSAFPILDRQVAPHNRYLDHIDMGMREFSFRITATSHTDAEAAVYNEPPFVISFFPSGEGTMCDSTVLCDSRDVLISSYKTDAAGNMSVHMHNTTDKTQSVIVNIPAKGISQELTFAPFELKLLKEQGKTLCE